MQWKLNMSQHCLSSSTWQLKPSASCAAVHVSRSRRKACTVALWDGRKRDGSKSSEQDIPVVVPDVLLPPPPKGNQYAGRGGNSTGSGGKGSGASGRGGGGRGGVFTMFSSGDMWSGGGKQSLANRLRLMVLSVAWGCAVYLLLSTVFRFMRWADSVLGITTALGFRPNARLGINQQAGSDDDGSEELVEAVGVSQQHVQSLLQSSARTQQGSNLDTNDLHASIATSTVPAAAAASSSLFSSLPLDPALQPGTTQAAGQQVHGQQAAGDSSISGVGTVAAPIDPEQKAYLDMLKQYERRQSSGHMAADMDAFSGHAIAAYGMILGTLAFFWVVQ